MQNDIYAEKGTKLPDKLNSQSFELDIALKLPAFASTTPKTATTGAIDYSRYQ